MKRREFIVGLGGAVAMPLPARAQQWPQPTVGFLGSDTADLYADRLRAMHQGLKDAGYIDGQNVTIEYRWAEGRNDRLPTLAAELVRRRVAVIATSTTPGILALKDATKTIPIVFYIAGDPVALGLVASMSRPAGNLTGTTTITLEVGLKWLELLREVAPVATTFALLLNPTSPTLAELQAKDLRSAARNLGLEIELYNASSDHQIDAVFAILAQRRPGGLVISSDLFFYARAQNLAALALRHRVPAIFGFREFAMAGGLMSYGANLMDQHHTLGVYIGRILKGEKPAKLPVQQSVKVELILNLKTAKALDLTIPPTLLARADEVIE